LILLGLLKPGILLREPGITVVTDLNLNHIMIIGENSIEDAEMDIL
jgi:hypothetical protein